MPVDFDAVADELYGLDPDAFVTARTAAVAAARQAKDRPLAARIGALKKPTRSAWLVNLLARTGDNGWLNELQELSRRTATAHQQADLAALRTVGTERQRLVDAVTKRALAVGAEQGYSGTEAVRAEVAGTIGAALADAEVFEQVKAGRVEKAQVYSGFGFPMAGAALAAPAQPAGQSSAPKQQGSDPADDTEAVRQAAQQAVAAATDRVVEARTALKAVQAAEQEAQQNLDRASQEVADLRAELRKAKQAEELARRAATQAADDVHDARTEVSQAEQALAEAARALG